MDEQERIDRLIEAVDRVVLEGETPGEDAGEFAPYLTLAARLKEEMAPVQPDPAFVADLRARLLAQTRIPLWRQWLGRLLPTAFGDTKPLRHQGSLREYVDSPLPLGEARPFPLPLGEGQGEGYRDVVGSTEGPGHPGDVDPRLRGSDVEGTRPVRRARPAWGYALATAAAAVLVAGAMLVYQGAFTGRSAPMPAQPAAGDAAVPAASAPSEPLAASAPGAAPQPAPSPGLRSAAEPPGGEGEAAVAMAAPPAPTTGAYAPEAALAMKASPLPVLPPVTASSPPTVVGGLGGSPIAADEVPARRIRFELATTLPELGPQVTVYRYRPPATDVEANRDLAARLGFDPDDLRPIVGAEGAYIVTDDENGTLQIHGAGGAITYHARIGTRPGLEPSRSLLPNARAVEVATDWLRERGLLPANASAPEVTLPYPEADFKDVTLRPAEPANIVTDDPRITVSVTAPGRVISAYVLWPEVESTVEYPAATAESTWAALEAGRAVIRFQGEHNRPDLDLDVRVTGAETGYAITFGLDGQAYLQPVVVFRGESSGGGETLPFSAWVPAVAGESVSSGETRYVLATSLPEMPPELSAFQPVYEAPAKEWVHQLGARFGLPGEPRLLEEWEWRFWEVRDGAGEWVLRVPADAKSQAGLSWLWSFGKVEQGLEGPGTAPAGEEAVRIATECLEGYGLYTPDLGEARVEPAPDGSATNVFFDGVGPSIAPDGRGVLSVGIDGRGEVYQVSSNQLPLRAVKTRPALSPEEAFELVQAGRGALVVPSLFGRQVYSDLAAVERVELVYVSKIEISEAPDPVTGLPVVRYEPYYRFSGTMEVGESRKRVPFTVSISAWAQ